MKIIDAGYEILTDISPFAIHELELIEAAARTSYKSEAKYKPQAESAKELIAKLIKRGHETPLEHSLLSVRFICDRGISHELVRHRLASFTQESTRYCNYSYIHTQEYDDGSEEIEEGADVTFVLPPWINKKDISDPKKMDRLCTAMSSNYPDPEAVTELLSLSSKETAAVLWYGTCDLAERTYGMLIHEHGWTPQQARAVLPNSLKTEVVVSANYREWRHILKLRCAKDAHPQMCELMLPLLDDLYHTIPVVFDDIYEQFFDEEGNIR